MRFMLITFIALLFGGVSLVGAGSHTLWDIDDARIAKKIEIQVDKSGAFREVEFHVDPSMVPAAVRAAMDKLHPGGTHVDAEVERQGGVTYYEITTKLNDVEFEAMFLPDGTLHAEENQVAASAVPEVARKAVATAFAGADVRKWEEIRDGGRNLVEYHVKLDHEGRRIKAMVSTAGQVTGAVLEVPAEIEVPIVVR